MSDLGVLTEGMDDRQRRAMFAALRRMGAGSLLRSKAVQTQLKATAGRAGIASRAQIGGEQVADAARRLGITRGKVQREFNREILQVGSRTKTIPGTPAMPAAAKLYKTRNAPWFLSKGSSPTPMSPERAAKIAARLGTEKKEREELLAANKAARKERPLSKRELEAFHARNKDVTNALMTKLAGLKARLKDDPKPGTADASWARTKLRSSRGKKPPMGGK